MTDLIDAELTGRIRQTAFEVHRYFGSGFPEKVYRNALAHRLSKIGFSVEQEKRLLVRDEDGTVVGDFQPDLFVAERVIVEVKAARTLVEDHVAQLLTYLKVSGVIVGTLVNFGEANLVFRRFVFDEARRSAVP